MPEGFYSTRRVGRSFAIDVTIPGFRIQARAVDLAREFPHVGREMLAILESIFEPLAAIDFVGRAPKEE